MGLFLRGMSTLTNSRSSFSSQISSRSCSESLRLVNAVAVYNERKDAELNINRSSEHIAGKMTEITCAITEIAFLGTCLFFTEFHT
jgi:hypothetical protein